VSIQQQINRRWTRLLSVSLASEALLQDSFVNPCQQLHCCRPWSAGYTPLHMASGYLHTPVVELLLAYGADPEVAPTPGLLSAPPCILSNGSWHQHGGCASSTLTSRRPQVRDLESRSVLDLVEGLKDKIPNDAAVAQRKFALERCTEILTGAA
jgi:Ankyrin repeat